jgi:hypothetical protein
MLSQQNCHFFYKSREQEGKTGLVWRVGTSARREDIRKECRKVNVVEIFCTNVCKWKNETC